VDRVRREVAQIKFLTKREKKGDKMNSLTSGGRVSAEMPMLRSETLKQRLSRQKLELEKRLKELNDAIEALDNNPEVESVLEKLSVLGI